MHIYLEQWIDDYLLKGVRIVRSIPPRADPRILYSIKDYSR